MRRFTYLLLGGMCIIALSFTTANQSAPSASDSSLDQGLDLENTVIIHSRFGKPSVPDMAELRKVSGKRIHHVDFVYTGSNKLTAANLKQLNERRLRELKGILPSIISDSPTMRVIERSEWAAMFPRHAAFHGYIIHYGNEINHGSLAEHFEEIQKPFTESTVTAEEGGVYTYESGTRITVPANAVTYADGTPVRGDFTLSYREFRNPAEIALSGLPMTFKSGSASYNFSSVGMYEIRGMQGDKELELQKPIEVDFRCTEQTEGVGFYQMDDQSGEWTRVKGVEFVGGAANPPANPDLAIDNNQIMNDTAVLDMQIRGEVNINDNWQNARNVNNVVWNNQERGGRRNRRGLRGRRGGKNAEVLDGVFLDEAEWNGEDGWQGQGVPRAEGDMSSTLLAEGINEGHTYPEMVKGLNSPDFGVYNCDQIYRLANAKSVSPEYIDQSSGKAIEKKFVACVLDLNYNGSFSFHPNYITCDTQGKNVILLFTEDERVFMMDEKAFASVNFDDETTRFNMKEVTGKIKTADDLKKELKI